MTALIFLAVLVLAVVFVASRWVETMGAGSDYLAARRRWREAITTEIELAEWESGRPRKAKHSRSARRFDDT